MQRFAVTLLALTLLALNGGCFHAISKDALSKVDPEVDFTRVLEEPEAYRGTVLLVGGQIMEVEAGREGSALEILQFPLDKYGEPETDKASEGRFLALTNRFLEAEDYKPGLFVTLTGSVEGARVKPLGEGEYRYPLLRIGEASVWPSYARDYPSPYSPWTYRPYPYYKYRGLYPYYDPFWPPLGPYPHYPYRYW
ncbi:MAG: hypothetical protein C0617_10115 [Desulfuromonas sp.]|uniref:Slp family lipoprotein n=1 Tax=Desulfuromonas sp. TaxID=892 RepID=UPI000CB45F77|nr:Slp family lipoprotein [Desulfuromonas sp.]PLX83871.1 MAG: hypothetical protein C0617_10115 [Desulfuromonas sp.]